MSSAPREATIPLTRWQYFTKTLYQNAAAKNLFVYNKVIYEKDEALRQTEEVNGRISMALLLVLLLPLRKRRPSSTSSWSRLALARWASSSWSKRSPAWA